VKCATLAVCAAENESNMSSVTTVVATDRKSLTGFLVREHPEIV